MLVKRLMSATSTSARKAAPMAIRTASAATRKSRRSAGPRRVGGVVKAAGCSLVIGRPLEEEPGARRAADGEDHPFEAGAERPALARRQGRDGPHQVGLDRPRRPAE